ncbi:MAG: hypothetical protein LRY41_03360 [Candidatus Pacebacteria bacterium]|nr:hypothetical protein [Candidatus Paceibacterota bacterium]MCD8528329.1 hypothetical protein [Candidatus Paceibacterota bacterium]MCD8563813.1 hypothetical protein [Candidatus Paceibacterota bacterium]
MKKYSPIHSIVIISAVLIIGLVIVIVFFGKRNDERSSDQNAESAAQFLRENTRADIEPEILDDMAVFFETNAQPPLESADIATLEDYFSNL